MRIKICGMTSIGDIEAANLLLPDYIGFVFAESRRKVTPKAASRLRAGLDGRILPAGVFVNEKLAAVAEIAEQCRLSAVQLHGDESPEYLDTLRGLLPRGCEIWKTIGVVSKEDIKGAEEYPADKLLFDTAAPGKRGGSGRCFDWKLLEDCRVKVPYFLAGGINPENILEASHIHGPYGLDLSSGAETDGLKDPDKMRRLIAAVRT